MKGKESSAGGIIIDVILGFVIMFGWFSVGFSDDVSDEIKTGVFLAVMAGVVLIFFLVRINTVNTIKPSPPCPGTAHTRALCTAPNAPAPLPAATATS